MENLRTTMFWSVGTMIMTTIHHFYGAYIYDGPIRLHAAIIAIPVIIVLLGTYFGQDRTQDTASAKRLRAIFIGVTFLFPIAAIGIYEGGYNHVIKDVLFFSGVPTQFLDRMYPSVYQLPDDFLFEFTGVAQFFTGVACTIFLFRSFRRKIVRA